MNKAVFIVAVVLFSVVSIAAQTVVSIRVRGETIVSGDRVALGDIAEITGAAEKVERLKNVSLGYAPQPGSVREIAATKLELAIAAAGFAAGEYRLETASAVLLRRGGQKIAAETLRAEVEKAVLTDFQIAGAEARIVRLDLPENIEVPTGTISVKAAAPNARNLFQPFAVNLEIAVDDRIVRRAAAKVQIEVWAPVLTAAKNLVANTRLRETDTKIERRKIEKPLTSYLRDAKDLRGALLAKNLPVDAEITTDAIIAGVVVKTGDAVRVVGQSGKMRISIAGEARASGRIGDRIAVKNLQSGAVLQAVVTDEGTVQINF